MAITTSNFEHHECVVLMVCVLLILDNIFTCLYFCIPDVVIYCLQPALHRMVFVHVCIIGFNLRF